jgi:hypothetical protein
MKKIFLFIVFGSFIAFGQNNEQKNNALLPNIIPPSPDAFAFTKYGNNSANEYNGKINLNIPIYEYSAGNLKLPISLNYSGAGVKVEDIPTWVGINWQLNVGGVITRQVTDRPDEYGREYINENHFKTNASNLCEPDSQYYYGLALLNDIYDTEVDIFNYSFLNYSGSFYLDESFSPVLIDNKDQLKIEFIGNSNTNLQNFIDNHNLCITTPDGVKYYFGSINTEVTNIISGTRINDSSGHTSFYLYKIQHPINGTILLEYDTTDNIIQKVSKSYSMTSKRLAFISAGSIGYFDESIFLTKNKLKRLKKISSLNNSIEIIFDRTEYPNNKNYSCVLNAINIKSKNSNNEYIILKKVTLDYGAKINNIQLINDFETASRFFLTEVAFDNELDLIGNKHEKYLLEYDDPFGLPDRMSNRRDELGYFNNANNLSLIDKDDRCLFYQGSTDMYFADLNPVFNFGKKGALKKIVYPTKGYSEFEYEPIKMRKEKYGNYHLIINSNPLNFDNFSNNQIIPGYTSNLGDEPYFINAPYIYEDQTIWFNLNLATPQHSNPSSIAGKGIEFIITDITDSLINTYTKVLPNSTTSGSHVYTFKKGHNYTFQLKFLNNYVSTNYQEIEGSVSLTNIFEGYTVFEHLGIRLKRQKDFNFDNALLDTKRYYYGNINKINDENVFKIYKKSYPMSTFTFDVVSEPGLLNINFSSQRTDKNRRLIPSYEIFPIVTTSYGGDNFENGGTEKYFLDIQNLNDARLELINDGCFYDAFIEAFRCGLGSDTPNQTVIHYVMYHYKSWEQTNLSYYNGKLLSERFYKKENNNLYKIKEQISNFEINQDFTKKVTNIVPMITFGNGQHGFHHCPSNPNVALSALGQCYFGYYYIRVLEMRLKDSKTIEYIDPIPLNNYVDFNRLYSNTDYFNENFNNSGESGIGYPDNNQDQIEAPYKKIITTQNFEYGTLKGLPTVITSNTSDSSIVNKTVNTYVNTAASLTNIPNNQIAIYPSLISQNRVASPIEVKQYKNTELLSTQRTLYNNFTVNSVTKILPEKIQIGKGDLTVNPLEDKAVFYNYDQHFNPVVMGYKDAPKTRYMFNTDGLVVAKIENYTATSSTFPLIVGNIDNTDCALQTQYPNAFVTVFKYNLITKKLIQTTDLRCQNSFYEYDDLHRLKLIKDHNGNIVKEFDQQFKPQN